jgi:hypothetical protein
VSKKTNWSEENTSRRRVKSPPLSVKEVWVDDRRYIVCFNEEQARKDAADRQAILATLADRLPKGAKSLIGNQGFRRYVTTQGEGFRIDPDRVTAEQRYDGKWVLRTNTDYQAADVALAYKQLWMVEDLFRSMKSLLATRPIYHRLDGTIRGHVFCSFLALLLRTELGIDVFEVEGALAPAVHPAEREGAAVELDRADDALMPEAALHPAREAGPMPPACQWQNLMPTGPISCDRFAGL